MNVYACLNPLIISMWDKRPFHTLIKNKKGMSKVEIESNIE